MLKSAVLVVSCSDSRLTADEPGESWREQLDFHGPIYEVRVPGGGLVLAEQDSSLSAAVLDSLGVLSQVKSISNVILACHSDCAYFQLRYAPQGASQASEERVQRRLIEYASRRLETAAPGITVQTTFVRLRATNGGFNLSDTRRPMAAPLGPDFVVDPVSPIRAGLRAPGEARENRMTAREMQHALYERELNGQADFEQPYEDMPMEPLRGGEMPAVHMERRTREFLEWARDHGGIRSSTELQRLGLGFVSNYGKRKPQRTNRFDTMEDPRLGEGRLRKKSFLPWKQS